MSRQRLRLSVLADIAENVAKLSTCSRLHVGALVVRDHRIISTGYNGVPAGMPHCVHLRNEREPCRVAVHAEANALVWAARLGGSGTLGATMIVTHSPCLECAKLIVNAGIEKVYYQWAYRLTEGVDFLREAGITCLSIDGDQGPTLF